MKVGGHRGFGVTDAPGRSGPYQENSYAAVQAAFDSGADFVEVDWVWDRDGLGWICHSSVLSEHFDHTPATYLDELSSAEVACLVGRGGQRLMSLPDLIERFGDRAVNIEIKGTKGSGRVPVGFWSQQVPSAWPSQWWLSSFDPTDLERACEIWPDTPVGLLSVEAGGAGQGYLSGRQALEYLARHPAWYWHPELTDRPDSDRIQFGWSMDPSAEDTCDLQGLRGLITDRVDAWCRTG